MKKIYQINPNDKIGFLEVRKLGVGGSDIAAICGLNPYSSILSVWYDKTKEGISADEENIPAEIGLILEDYLEVKFVKKFKEKYDEDIKLERIPFILEHDDYNFCRCTLDRYFMRGEEFIPVEFKTTSEYQKEKWEGDEIPEEYYLQIQWQIFITGAKIGYIGFLIGNRIFDIKEVKRNDEVIKMMLKRATDFWNNYVLKNIMPAPDGSEASTNVLKELYAIEVSGKVLEPTDEEEGKIIEAAENAKVWNDRKKEAEKNFQEQKNKIIAIMKDSELVFISGKKVTFKTIHRDGYTVGPTEYRTLDIRSFLK